MLTFCGMSRNLSDGAMKHAHRTDPAFQWGSVRARVCITGRERSWLNIL